MSRDKVQQRFVWTQRTMMILLSYFSCILIFIHLPWSERCLKSRNSFDSLVVPVWLTVRNLSVWSSNIKLPNFERFLWWSYVFVTTVTTDDKVGKEVLPHYWWLVTVKIQPFCFFSVRKKNWKKGKKFKKNSNFFLRKSNQMSPIPFLWVVLGRKRF